MNKQLPPGAVVRGEVHAVPCPHCGKTNDFRELDGQQLLDSGNNAVCDHCNQNMQIVQVRPTKIVAVRKTAMSRINNASDARPAAPARTVGPNFLQKLLGKGGR